MKGSGSASKLPEAVISEDEFNRLEVIPDYCKDCGICIAFCPTHILESRGGTVIVTDIAGCTGCGQCELRCPDFAITVTAKKRRTKKVKKQV
ncbi:MAG: 4Fe-4S dicluster domain-containing protein [Deltaproteobacteria bacterium]|nr:4Fe-4S dicluster domain-containing protein [Deltaproteobacteria bacterium]